MARFLVTYHGGEMPADDKSRQQAMAAFAKWVEQTGKALIDPGAPLGPAKTVSSTSVTDGPAGGRFGGYSVVEANDIDAAVNLVAKHPFLQRGGSLQVSPTVSP
jgi:hypothetical protein